jgi:hypothetical protein
MFAVGLVQSATDNTDKVPALDNVVALAARRR